MPGPIKRSARQFDRSRRFAYNLSFWALAPQNAAKNYACTHNVRKDLGSPLGG
jgi:hypothetical protein